MRKAAIETDLQGVVIRTATFAVNRDVAIAGKWAQEIAIESIAAESGIRIGGHFAGYQVLHWKEGGDGMGMLFAGDLPQVCMDRRWVSFMYSYPNYLPLSAASVSRIVAALEPFEFGKLFGAWPGFVVHAEAKIVVRLSAERYLRALTIDR